MYTFGFIGAGNMGGALAKAASKSTKNILIADHFTERAEKLSIETGTNVGDNSQIASECQYIFLGVKPQMMADMLGEIKDILKSRNDDFVLVTMAAGLSIETIRTMAGGAYKVIRIMPNTPVEVGEGQILYCKSDNVTANELKAFLENMKHAGNLTEIPENLMDAGCSVSGCGPAFVYMFIRGLAEGGIECGIDEKTALTLAAQTVLGSAKLLIESKKDPSVLIENVCSPGGSTIEGVKSLDNDNLEDVVVNAVTASYERNIELGKA
ncbi:MAG: pyrroline-5-carboxylate reductase [Ruminococcus sp.]|nr:pyrroline-5-carboxylate reductase [Ruminococcus sp.]